MARVGTSDFQPPKLHISCPLATLVWKRIWFWCAAAFWGTFTVFCFLNRFFFGFHGAQGCFGWQEPILEEKQVPRRFHGGCTEVPRRFHGGSTEVSGPTPKNSCNLRRNPHIPQNALNSQAFSGAPRVRPNVGCEPPFLQSCRVCFVSGEMVDPKRRIQMLLFHVGFWFQVG